MNHYLNKHYRETKTKFDKFSSRLQKSQERGEFYRLSPGKQNFLVSRVKKLWEKLRILEMQLKIASVGASVAMMLMVSNVSAQDQFVHAPEKNPLPSPTIVGENPYLVDIDNDGDLDLLLDGYYGIGFYRNTGTVNDPVFEKVPDEQNPFLNIGGYGYFSLHSIVDAADIDDDGDVDIVTRYDLLRNTGSNENIVFTREDNKRHPNNSRLGDIDNDGDLDVLHMHYNFDQIHVYKNTGGAADFIISELPDTLYISNWNEELNRSGDFHLLDIDADGDLDILAGVVEYEYSQGYSITKSYKLIENTGTKSDTLFNLVDDAVNPYAGIEAGQMSMGDLDADGDIDVITFDEYGSRMLQVFEFTVDTVAESKEMITEFYDGITLAASVIAPSFVDIDNDGDLDIYHWNSYGSGNLIEQISTEEQLKFRHSDQKTFDFLDGSAYIQIPYFVDLDRDGDTDIVRLDYDDDISYTYLQNTGSDDDPVYEAEPFIDFPPDVIALPAFVDLDNDGDLDMAFTSSIKIGENWVVKTFYYESIGDDPLEFARREGGDNPFNHVNDSNYEELREYQTPVFSDIDEDGDMDVLFTTYDGILFFENTGADPSKGFIDKSDSGPFASITEGLYYSTLNLVDFDKDGDDDLFVHSYYGTTEYYENLGGSGVGIQNIHVESLDVYPNPAASELNVMIPEQMSGSYDYEVITLDGRSIYSGSLDNAESLQEYKISLESFNPGHYFLRVYSGEKVFTTKFVKQ